MQEAVVEKLQCGTSEARADARRSVGRFTGRNVQAARRAVTVSRPTIIIFGVLAGVFCAVFVCLAGNFSNILLKQIRDAYILYRVTNERDSLRATLRQMEEEVVSLRLARSKEQVVESQFNQQVAALKEVVSLAGSLGLLNQLEDKNGNGRSAARYHKRNELRELAQALSGEKSSSKEELPERLAHLRALNQGLGGAEVECRRDKKGKVRCETEVAKRPISLKAQSGASDSTSAHRVISAVATGSLLSEGDRPQAIETLAQVTRALRVLPIGSPVAGRLTSGFGHRHSPFSHSTSFHEGVDISLARGGSVLATADGLVTKVDYDGTYGWLVDIEHTPDLVTRYAHLSRPLVKPGAVVVRGEKIALSGSTGRSTGPHLHYEVRFKDAARDPKPFLALADRLRSFS